VEYRRRHKGVDCKVKLDTQGGRNCWFVEVQDSGAAVYSRVSNAGVAVEFAEAAADLLAHHHVIFRPKGQP